jgi:hypothetical protein
VRVASCTVDPVVDRSVGAGVEFGVESKLDPVPPASKATPGSPAPALALRLLGPLAVTRGGKPVALPHSRKVRALLAYLVLAERQTSRSHLCELLFDLPSDPRGELRWCLSKLRGVLDAPDRTRIITADDSISLDLDGCSVDALEVVAALRAGLASLPSERLAALDRAFGGPRAPRRPRAAAKPRVRGLARGRTAPLPGGARGDPRNLVGSLPAGSEPALHALESWLAIAPFDRRAHEQHLDALASRGLLREGDEHLAAAARRFEGEGQDWAPIGHAWRAAKARHARPAAAGSLAAGIAGASVAADAGAAPVVTHAADHRHPGGVAVASRGSRRGRGPAIGRRCDEARVPGGHALRGARGRGRGRSHGPGRARRRPCRRRRHAPGQAAQRLRDRPGHHVRARRPPRRLRGTPGGGSMSTTW